MKKRLLTGQLWGFQKLFIAIIIISIYSCSVKETAYEEVSEGLIREASEDSGPALPDSLIGLDDYSIILAVDRNLKMNETAELRVWIGATGVNVSFSQEMVQDETIIPASIGQYAKIKPYAPDFEVYPSEIKCIRTHPSGLDVRFSLKPKKTGSLKVSADIELYNCVNCTCTSVPKTAATLSVVVKVDKKHLIVDKLKEMGAIVWDKFLNFWSAVIALVFAVLLFLIRRKLKRKTGFDDNKKLK